MKLHGISSLLRPGHARGREYMTNMLYATSFQPKSNKNLRCGSLSAAAIAIVIIAFAFANEQLVEIPRISKGIRDGSNICSVGVTNTVRQFDRRG